MRDRVSTKILNNGATRYGVYDETGALLRYEYIKLEDEPTVEGDFFNKANMLPDHIPALLGLKMGNPQVKDALNVLANVGNLHVWERVQTYREEVPAGYTLGPSKQIELIKGKNNSGNSISYRTITVSYSSSISVSENGDSITLNSPSTVNLRPDYPAEGVVLRGKFIQVTQWDSMYVDTVSGVLFIQSDASFADDYPNSLGWHSLTCSSAQVVTGTPAIPAGTTTDYLTSTDRNAYPDQSAEGGQDAYYTLGDAVTGKFGMVMSFASIDYIFSVASEISVADDGTISLKNPSKFRIGGNDGTPGVASNVTTAIAGKYIQMTQQGPREDQMTGPFSTAPSAVLYIPSDVVATREEIGSGNTYTWYFIDRYQPVTGHAAIPDNNTITYLGQLGGGARIEVGSYVGTGTTPTESNPMSVNTEAEIKFFWILPFCKNPSYNYIWVLYDRFMGNESYYMTPIFVQDIERVPSGYYQENGMIQFLSNGKKTINWYSRLTSGSSFNSANFYNISGYTYYYIVMH